MGRELVLDAKLAQLLRSELLADPRFDSMVADLHALEWNAEAIGEYVIVAKQLKDSWAHHVKLATVGGSPMRASMPMSTSLPRPLGLAVLEWCTQLSGNGEDVRNIVADIEADAAQMIADGEPRNRVDLMVRRQSIVALMCLAGVALRRVLRAIVRRFTPANAS